MNWLKKFFGHLKTILTHKKWVFYYMSKLGFPFRGFVHDFSKLSPTEFFEGVRFWDGKRSPVLVAKERLGISYAWLHHRGRNKHHYEYWIDKLDQGGVPQPIPFKYVIEMDAIGLLQRPPMMELTGETCTTMNTSGGWRKARQPKSTQTPRK